MNIGDAARETGLPAKTIRYYEEIGLVCADRRANGYRDYGPAAIEKLRFVGRARSLGFTVQQCRDLLSLYEDPGRASAEVKAVAEDHLKAIEAKLDELRAMHRTLNHLVHACHGDERPDCPILEDLAAAPVN